MKIGERFNPYTHFNMDVYEIVGGLVDVLGKERFLQLLEPVAEEADRKREEKKEGEENNEW